MTHYNKGEPTKTYFSHFRDCKDSDFNGVQDFETNYRLCPETEDNEKFYEI